MYPHVYETLSSSDSAAVVVATLLCSLVTILPWTSCPLLPRPTLAGYLAVVLPASKMICASLKLQMVTYLRFLAALLGLLCGLPTGDGFASSVGHDRLVTEILLSSHWHLDSCHGGSSHLLSLWASLVSPHHNFTRPLLTCFRYPVWSQH